MKILIINQPVGNRGDESAHRALLRKLSILPDINIDVAFIGATDDLVEPIQVYNSKIKYILFPFSKGHTRIPKWIAMMHLDDIAFHIIPAYSRIKRLINNSDLVICAPGGICMGGFMNWEHVLLLEQVVKSNKPLVYYSRSFGPFSDESYEKKLFQQKSLKLLNEFSFLSIRDQVTMELAESLNIPYTPSVDTAFLEVPKEEIDNKLSSLIGSKYIVFVPNELIWHPSYRLIPTEKIEQVYLKIINALLSIEKEFKLILLPQLYGTKSLTDYSYFVKLRDNSKYKERVIVIDDKYSSDLQQTIISKAGFVIGARYHSIVFAVNNSIPFFSLSYEHKMFGLIQLIHAESCQFDIRNIGRDDFDAELLIATLLKSYRQRKNQEVKLRNEIVKDKVNKCYYSFEKLILKLND